MTHRLSLERIAEASRVVAPLFLGSPQFVSEPLSEALGIRTVAPAGAPCMTESFRRGHPVEAGPVRTIADGMATRVAVPQALADLRGTVADVLLVEDADMIHAMRLAHRHLGLVLEP